MKEIMENNPLVTIGVCTRKRPEMIVKCLRSLFAQETDFRYDIVVTENDATQGSRAVIESLIPEAAEKGVELRYFCEPQQGISYARNRCVAECRGEFLAFIDDDEWTEPDWLMLLVEAQRQTDAGVVCGYVRPVFEEGFPEYLKDIDTEKMPSQDIVETLVAYTGSVLYQKALFDLREFPFLPEYAKTGCEDIELSYFFKSKGVYMVKSYRPIAYEFQPMRRGRMIHRWEEAFRWSCMTTQIIYKYYYRMNGSREVFKRLMYWFRETFVFLPMLFVRPRRAFYMIGLNIATCAGTLAYFIGYRRIGYR